MRLIGLSILCLTLFITGCANHLTLKREVNLKNSTTVFLQPTNDKTVYLEIKNVSDKPQAVLGGLPAKLTAKGYTVLQDPDKAHFIVQVTTVFAAKAKPGTTLDSLVAGGFGGMIGGSIGAAAALGGGHFGLIPGGGALGATAGFLGSKITEDTQLTIVVDTRIIEKTKEVTEQVITSQHAPGSGLPTQPTGLLNLGNQSLSPPNAGQNVETIHETRRGHQRMHTTRSAAIGQEMWMNEQEAINDLTTRLTDSISGFF